MKSAIFCAVLALCCGAFAASAAADDDVYMKHCVVDDKLDPEDIIASCKVFINDAYQQNWLTGYIPEALYNKAVAERRAGRLGEVKKDIAAAVKMDPAYIPPWKLLVEISSNLTGNDALMAGMDAMIHANTTDVQVLNAACRKRAELGLQLQAAVADCDEAVRIDPKSTESIDSRCFALYRLGDYPHAIEDCSVVVQREPKTATAFYVRGLAYRKTGDAGKSASDIAAAKAIDPKIADTYAGYGVVP